MIELKNKEENEYEFEIEERVREFTACLKDLVIMQIIPGSLLVGIFIILSFYFKMQNIIIFTMLFISWIVYVFITIIKSYNFKVVRQGYNIKLSYGLFHKMEKIISVKTIQSLIIVEGVIKKPLGYLSIKVETMKYGKNKGEIITICPIAKSNLLDNFLKDIIPEMNIEYELRTSKGKALNGFILTRLLEGILVISLVSSFLPYGYYGFLLIPILLVWKNISFKDNGLYFGDDFVVMRFRKLGRSTVIICKDCIQSFEKEQNIFQKKNAIAKYTVTIAVGSAGKSYKVGYIGENSFY